MNAGEPLHIRDLERRLAESEATVKALLAGEIDAVVDARTNTPLLLSKARDALLESAERYRILFEKSPMPKWLYDVATLRFLAVNDAAVRQYGYSREEFLGMTIKELRPEGDAAAVVQELESVSLGPHAFGVRKHRKKDGTLIDVEVSGHTFPLDGRLALLVIAQDITERRRGEDTLRWLAAIVDTSWDAIIGTDQAGIVTSWNPGAERLYGYAAAEVLGKHISIVTPPAAGDVDRKLMSRAIAGEMVRDFESISRRKDGTEIQVSMSLAVIRNAAGTLQGTSGVVRDITHQKAAEKQVRLLHDIVLAAGVATTLDETLEVVLRLICQATGAPAASAWVPGAAGRLEHRGQWARPEDRERFKKLFEGWSFGKGEGLPGRVWAGQQAAWVDDSCASPEGPRSLLAGELGLSAGLAVPILVGDELIAVVEAFLPSGGKKESLMALLSAVAEQLGSVLQRRRAEDALHKSEEQFRQAQKMEAIGQLTGGVAHDFNNLLSVILSYSSLLADDMGSKDPRREDLLEIRSAAERAAGLTQQLLAFSRQQVLQPRVVDLNQVVSGMEKMLRRLIGEDVELTVIAAPEAARVHVDPGQMEQVIMNLAVNARDAMPTGGKLTIEVERVQLDDSFAGQHPGATAGPNIRLSVSDNGCGMDAATQARVFEPFYTTKERGKGTGLGLSTVFGIVRQSAGTIWLYSEPGKGTSFKVYFPVAEAGVEKAVVLPAEAMKLRGNETVLLVEDEEAVRKLVRSVLQRNGYRVVEARDGMSAIEMAAGHGVIDLLLTDVVMPNMSGAETATRLRALRPGLKLLYMSGYTDNAVVLHGVLRSEAAFVQKPITPALLLSKVREVLDAA